MMKNSNSKISSIFFCSFYLNMEQCLVIQLSIMHYKTNSLKNQNLYILQLFPCSVFFYHVSLLRFSKPCWQNHLTHSRHPVIIKKKEEIYFYFHLLRLKSLVFAKTNFVVHLVRDLSVLSS